MCQAFSLETQVLKWTEQILYNTEISAQQTVKLRLWHQANLSENTGFTSYRNVAPNQRGKKSKNSTFLTSLLASFCLCSLNKRSRMETGLWEEKRNISLQYLEVPSAVRAVVNESVSNKCDDSRTWSSSLKVHDLWLTPPSSCPFRELCDQHPALNLPLFEIY